MKKILNTILVATLLVLGSTQAWANELRVSGSGFNGKVANNKVTLDDTHMTFVLSGTTAEYNSNAVTLASVDAQNTADYTLSWNAKDNIASYKISSIKLNMTTDKPGTVTVGSNSTSLTSGTSGKSNIDCLSSGAISGSSINIGLKSDRTKIFGISTGSTVFTLNSITIEYSVTPSAPSLTGVQEIDLTTTLDIENPTTVDLSPYFTSPGEHFALQYTQSNPNGHIEGNYFYATQAGNYFVSCQVAALSNCHEASASASSNLTIHVEDPSAGARFKVASTNIGYNFDNTSGEVGYTLENEDGSEFSSSTDVDWISNIQFDEINSKITFSMTQNTTDANRVGTLTVSYGDISHDITVTQRKEVVTPFTVTYDRGAFTVVPRDKEEMWYMIAVNNDNNTTLWGNYNMRSFITEYFDYDEVCDEAVWEWKVREWAGSADIHTGVQTITHMDIAGALTSPGDYRFIIAHCSDYSWPNHDPLGHFKEYEELRTSDFVTGNYTYEPGVQFMFKNLQNSALAGGGDDYEYLAFAPIDNRTHPTYYYVMLSQAEIDALSLEAGQSLDLEGAWDYHMRQHVHTAGDLVQDTNYVDIQALSTPGTYYVLVRGVDWDGGNLTTTGDLYYRQRVIEQQLAENDFKITTYLSANPAYISVRPSETGETDYYMYAFYNDEFLQYLEEEEGIGDGTAEGYLNYLWGEVVDAGERDNWYGSTSVTLSTWSEDYGLGELDLSADGQYYFSIVYCNSGKSIKESTMKTIEFDVHNTPQPVITASNAIIEATTTAHDLTYSLDNECGECHMAASVTAGGEWLTVASVDEEHKTIHLTMTENSSTTDARVGTVHLTYGTAQKDVTISQAKRTNNPVINVTSGLNIEINGDGVQHEFAYTITNPTSASLQANTTSYFISNIQVEGARVLYTVTEYVGDGAPRVGTITLSYTGAVSKVVTITQTANAESNSPEIAIVAVDDVADEIANSETSGSFRYEITNPTSAHPTVSCNQAWLSNFNINEETHTVTYTAQHYYGDDDRRATVTMRYTGAVDATAYIVQHGRPAAGDIVISADGTLEGYADQNTSASDVTVNESRTLTITSNVQVHDVTLLAGAELQVQAGQTLTIHSLNMQAGLNTRNTYGIPSLNIAATAHLSKTVETVNYDLYVDARNFYPFAVPCAVAVNNIDYANPSYAALSRYGSDYVIKRYDGQARANNGKNREANWVVVGQSETLQPGVGYIIAAVVPGGETYAVIRIPLNLTEVHSSVEVSAYGKGTDTDEAHVGWNFIAQPYMAEVKASGVTYISVPRYNMGSYDQLEAASANIRPEWGFFVQVDENSTITFAPKATSLPLYAPAYTREENSAIRAAVRLVDAQGAHTRTNIIIDNTYTSAYEINADLEKMFGDAYTMEVYTLSGSQRLAFNALDEATAANVVALGYRAPAAGTYTLELDEDYVSTNLDNLLRLELTDAETGIVTNLLSMPYSFETARTQSDNRFTLRAVFAPKVTTDMDAISERNDVHKELRNGMLLIRREDKVYNVLGQQE